MNYAGRYKFRSPKTKATSASSFVRQFFEGLTEKGITIQQAADDCGMSRVSLQYWKSGQRSVDIIIVEHLCKKYGIRIVIE